MNKTKKSIRWAGALSSVCLLVGAWRIVDAQNLVQLLGLHGGKEIYQAACTACHGANGEGTPESIAGFERPDTFPHFNNCEETTPETTRNWKAVVRDGGKGRGFVDIMPSFSGVLTPAQIDEVVAYLRSLCSEPEWPRGELNVPRALMTEKAFPESETVLTTAVNAQGAPGWESELAYEQRLTIRDQLEVAVPMSWYHKDTGGYSGGIGDIAFGLKHVLFSSLTRNPSRPVDESSGSIFSVQGEVVLPTGNADKGLGTGETTAGLFGAYDIAFASQAFIQLQAGVDVPFHASDEVPRAAFFRSAFGKTFAGDGGYARMWSPMIEFVADRDLVDGAKTNWDAVPEFQVTLNKRQHVRAALGYRVPLNNTADRSKQVMFYFLWDWFDGGLTEGW